MSSKRAVVEDLNSYPSWFETVNFMSALAIPPTYFMSLIAYLVQRRPTGRARLVCLNFSQTKAGMYYCNRRIEGLEVCCEE